MIDHILLTTTTSIRSGVPVVITDLVQTRYQKKLLADKARVKTKAERYAG
jgi:hypothetical protein